MHLNPSEISELIKSRIAGLETTAEVRTQGTIVSVTDGIVRVHGLSDVMQGEMLEFPGNTFGLALNLERDSVGAVILGEYEHITEGVNPIVVKRNAILLQRAQRALRLAARANGCAEVH